MSRKKLKIDGLIHLWHSLGGFGIVVVFVGDEDLYGVFQEEFANLAAELGSAVISPPS